MTEPTIEPELTLDQELRFNILVPFYGAVERKRQEDAGKLTKQDASQIYTEAIKKIERIISDQVAKARIDERSQAQQYLHGLTITPESQHLFDVLSRNNYDRIKEIKRSKE